jgi:hypothetical protein
VELDYVQITTGVNITGSTEGTANTLITGTSQTYAAEAMVIEVFSPQIVLPTVAQANVIILLYDGGTVLGRLGIMLNPAADLNRHVFYAAHRLTPTAATHQYIVKATASSTTGTPSFGAGAGGSGTAMPAFIRITKV